MRIADTRHLTATAAFDVEDAYARDRGVLGPHPRPMRPVRYVLTHRVAAGVRTPLSPAAELQVQATPSGYDVFFGVVRGERGRLARRVDGGDYVLRLRTGGVYAEAELEVSLPRPAPPYGIALEPGHAYPFPAGSPIRRSLGPTVLRGALQDAGGHPVDGARVTAPDALYASTTDGSGQWVLVFPDSQPSGDVAVHFALPDGSGLDVTAVPIVAGRDVALRQTQLHGLVTTTAGTALPGATVAVDGRAGATTAGDDGAWDYTFAPGQPATTVSVVATLPDGRTQRRNNVPVQPRSTVDVPSFRFG